METTHTYREWKRIHNARMRAKRKKIIEMLIQKAIGVLLIVLGIIFAYIFVGEDQTAALLLWVFGIFLFFYPKRILGTI